MKTRLKIGVRNCSTQHIASSQIGSVEFHRLLEISDEEWQGILRFGRYCSFPLVVCARLKQANIGSRQQTCRFWGFKDRAICCYAPWTKPHFLSADIARREHAEFTSVPTLFPPESQSPGR